MLAWCQAQGEGHKQPLPSETPVQPGGRGEEAIPGSGKGTGTGGVGRGQSVCCLTVTVNCIPFPS